MRKNVEECLSSNPVFLVECPECGSDEIDWTNSDGSQFNDYEWKSESYECTECGAQIDYERNSFLETYDIYPKKKKGGNIGEAFWGSPIPPALNGDSVTDISGSSFWEDSGAKSTETSFW